MRKKRILVYSDFDSIRNIIVKALANKDCEVIETNTFASASEQLNGTGFSLIITDNDIKNKEGTKFIAYLRGITSYLYTPIMLMHSSRSEQVEEQYSEYNIACYMNKPFDMQKFNSVVDRFA
jgi:two-component system chemotaxis response regulator CheY